MQMMTQYYWPGDLAELTSVMQAASNNCQGNEIDAKDLPEKFRFAIAALKSPPNEIIEIKLENYLSDIERQLVDRALQMAKGNKTKAAKLLGVSRAKLLRRIQHFELEQPVVSAAEDQPDAGLSADDFRPLDEPLFEEADE
jgi:transcriptional regulator with PAS, ATPase and Fis domain